MEWSVLTFVSQGRRLAAVRELVRLLKPGGRALIYVWAFEQEYNKQKSKYLKEHNKEHHGTINQSLEDNQETHCHLEDGCNPTDDMQDVTKVTKDKLSVHTNRTAFNTQDLLVPWHLKGKKLQGEGKSVCRISSNTDHNLGFDSNNDVTRCSDDKSSAVVDTSHTTDSTSKEELGSGSVPVFHRYYHVFQQGELEQLCAQVAGVKVQTSYHDQGNWCVVLRKD